MFPPKTRQHGRLTTSLLVATIIGTILRPQHAYESEKITSRNIGKFILCRAAKNRTAQLEPKHQILHLRVKSKAKTTASMAE